MELMMCELWKKSMRIPGSSLQWFLMNDGFSAGRCHGCGVEIAIAF
jgi:hypothetical protein